MMLDVWVCVGCLVARWVGCGLILVVLCCFVFWLLQVNGFVCMDYFMRLCVLWVFDWIWIGYLFKDWLKLIVIDVCCVTWICVLCFLYWFLRSVFVCLLKFGLDLMFVWWLCLSFWWLVYLLCVWVFVVLGLICVASVLGLICLLFLFCWWLCLVELW